MEAKILDLEKKAAEAEDKATDAELQHRVLEKAPSL